MGTLTKKFPIIISLFVLFIVVGVYLYSKQSNPVEEKLSSREYIFRFLLDKEWKNSNQDTTIVFKSSDMNTLEIIENGESNDTLLYKYDVRSKEDSFVFTSNKSSCYIDIKGENKIICQFASNVEGNGGLSVPIELTSK